MQGPDRPAERTRQNASAMLATAVVDELVALGVRHVVLCPGSRSAPLAYALHAADLAGRLSLHVRHDERVAGFTALGMGRAPATPGAPAHVAAVVTTSGTAVANLHPAVLEAHHAGVPLLVLSADRPHRMRGTWANQTSELQSTMFGPATRRTVDLAAPTPGADVPVGPWRAEIGAGVAAARGEYGGRPGPVHLDLAFDDPLVPEDVTATAEEDDADPPEPVAAQPVSESVVQASAAHLGPGPRTVLVAGDGAGDGARLLAEAAGWPLLAEPTSGARWGANSVPAYRLLLDHPDLGARVQRAVVVGRPTLSRPVTRLLAREDVEVVVLAEHEDDPAPGRVVHRWAGLGLAAAVAGRAGAAVDDGWLTSWTVAGERASAALDEVLDGWSGATGPVVAREVCAAAAPDELLVVAASNPVRDLDLAGRPTAAYVVANRGLAGIDGTVSTATGLALAADAPVRVLVGDVALLHDAGGLLLGPGETVPDLQVVVLNDDGGGIFGLLEHGAPERVASFERVFGTPHGTDLASLAAAYGVPYRVVGDVMGLRDVLAGWGRGGGRQLVEVRAERSTLRDLHAAIGEAVRIAVAEPTSAAAGETSGRGDQASAVRGR